MQRTLPSMSIPSPFTSVEVGLVKCGAGCLMVVSCMVLRVKITKAGTFSSPHSAVPAWKPLTITHFVTEWEGGVARMRRQHKQDRKKFLK